MSKSKFENLFYKHLHEDDISDREAMVRTLDDDTDPSEFDGARPNPQGAENQVAQAISQRQAEMVSQVREWSDRMEEFIEYLNGTESSTLPLRSSREYKLLSIFFRTSLWLHIKIFSILITGFLFKSTTLP